MYRKDILIAVSQGATYDDIMSKSQDAREGGFIYETISITLIISKHLIPNHDHISDDHLEEATLMPVTHLSQIYERSISQGNNPSDITLSIQDFIIPFGIKKLI